MSDETIPGGAAFSPRGRFDVLPHVADGGCSIGSLIKLTIILCGVGIMLGMAVSFIGRFLYLIVLFPLGMGAVVGAVGAWAIKKYKIRKPYLCGITGLLAGCFTFLAMHYGDYEHLEGKLAEAKVPEEVRQIARHIDEFKAKGEQVPEEIRELIRELEARPDDLAVLRIGSFWDFMDYQATQGVTLSKVGAGGGKGVNLGYTGSFIYWGVESLLLAGVALSIMYGAASLPFCLSCESWKDEQVLGNTATNASGVGAAVQEGDLAKVSDSLTVSSDQTAKVSAFVCPNCGTAEPIEVKVTKISVNKKGEKSESQVAMVTYPGESLSELQSLFRPATTEEFFTPVSDGEANDSNDETGAT
jgi:hypothetical protein